MERNIWNSGEFPGTTNFGFNEKLPIEMVTRTPVDDIKTKTIIPFFGCSFTYGQGLEYKDTFTNILQRDYLCDTEYLALNLGSIGFSLDGVTRVIHQYYNRTDIKHSNVLVLNLPPVNRREFFSHKSIDYAKNKWNHDAIIDTTDIEFRRLMPGSMIKNQDKLWYSYLEMVNPLVDYNNIQRNLVLLAGVAARFNLKIFLWNYSLGIFNLDDKNALMNFMSDLGIEFIEIPTIIPRGDNRHHKYQIAKNDSHFNQDGMTHIASYINKALSKYI